MSSTAPRAGAREWAGLAVLALPVLLLALDNSVLFLAAPHLGADLRPSATQLLWIMDVYGFMVAGFMITMGTLGDRIGRRRLLLTGAAAFAGASVLAAYAASPEMMIVARMLLGVTGATLGPSALALIGMMFADPRQRAMAFGIFTACFMGGAALGPVVGGVLLESFWWGSVFLLGVPVMAILLVAGPLVLPEYRDTAAGRVDLASVGLSLAAIMPVIYGLKEIADEPARAVPYAAVVVGLAFGLWFVRRQRSLETPLLDLALFKGRGFAAALAILLLTGIVQSGLYLFVSQYLQLVEGMAPLKAGLWLVPPTLALGVGSVLAPVVARRFRSSHVMGAGLGLAGAGLLAMAAADGLGLLMTGVVIGFFGTAPVSVFVFDLIVGAAPVEKAGSASAIAQTSGEFGIALGVATLGSLGTAVYGSRIDVPGQVPAGARETAADSLSGAVEAAADLPAAVAADLLRAAHAAFSDALAAVSVTSAALVLALAAVSLVALRSVALAGEDAGKKARGDAGETAEGDAGEKSGEDVPQPAAEAHPEKLAIPDA
ncbi:MFS transporter [Spirillospora sp. NPDC048911]|uniref:MFS transporter n=1 Tax=Spirillospora sp. NPDC048911 TaxID=3364527 RepID=UPI003718E4E3